MNKMNRNSLLALLLAALLLTLGCSAPPLDACYDEETVLTRANEAFTLACAQDYERLSGMVRADLREQVPPDLLAGAFSERLDKAGAFVELVSAEAFGSTGKEDKIPYATVIMIGQYEKGKVVYTFVLDPDYELVGLYQK